MPQRDDSPRFPSSISGQIQEGHHAVRVSQKTLEFQEVTAPKDPAMIESQMSDLLLRMRHEALHQQVATQGSLGAQT
ncbi:MAG: hypothetical protein Kow0056_09860 [Coriobacteriia bacterium]